ncbi:hypothetical protein IAR50_003468 [Cryptococcus sp. DSM 104548]
MDPHGRNVSPSRLEPLHYEDIKMTPPPSNPATSEIDTRILDGDAIPQEVPRSPEGMQEPWEERCQILMRENKLLKENWENWENKCRAIEGKQKYLSELSAICDATSLKDMKSELRGILDSIVREKGENMLVLRELNGVRDENILELPKDDVPFPTLSHTTPQSPPLSRTISRHLYNLFPPRRHSIAPYSIEGARTRAVRKVRSVTGTGGAPPLGRSGSMEQRMVIENWRQNTGESEELVMQTPTSLVRPLSPMSGDEWQEIVGTAVHSSDPKKRKVGN